MLEFKRLMWRNFCLFLFCFASIDKNNVLVIKLLMLIHGFAKLSKGQLPQLMTACLVIKPHSALMLF